MTLTDYVFWLFAFKLEQQKLHINKFHKFYLTIMFELTTKNTYSGWLPKLCLPLSLTVDDSATPTTLSLLQPSGCRYLFL